MALDRAGKTAYMAFYSPHEVYSVPLPAGGTATKLGPALPDGPYQLAVDHLGEVHVSTFNQGLFVLRGAAWTNLDPTRQLNAMAIDQVSGDVLFVELTLEFILRWATARRPDQEHAMLYQAAIQQVRPEHQEKIRDMSSKMRLTFAEAWEQKAQERYELGKAEGEAKGALNACRADLCVILESRFGPLSEELRGKIDTSDDIEQLRGCIERAPHITSPDELAL